MTKASAVDQSRRVWPGMEIALLMAFLVFLGSTAAFEAMAVLIAWSPAAVALIGVIVFAQGYGFWLYVKRVRPILARNAAEFPESVRACSVLFLVAALLPSAIAGLGVYVILSAHRIHG